MAQTIEEIEAAFDEFVQNEIDSKEQFDISKFGNPNARPADKTTWINVQKEKDRLIALHKKTLDEKTLKLRLEVITTRFCSWF